MTTTKGYWVVDIRWDFVLSACIVKARTRESAIKKAKKIYPAYEILTATPYRYIE